MLIPGGLLVRIPESELAIQTTVRLDRHAPASGGRVQLPRRFDSWLCEGYLLGRRISRSKSIGTGRPFAADLSASFP